MKLDPRRIEVMDDDTAALLRSKSADESMRMLDGMWQFVRQMTMAGVRAEHPEWSATMIEAEAARLLAHAH